MHHYLMFARESMNVVVWDCVLSIDGKTFLVPWCCSIFVGSVFNPAITTKGSTKRKRYQLRRQLAGGKVDEWIDVKVSGLALWNANAKLHVNPWDPYLLQELAFSQDNEKLPGEDVSANANPDRFEREVVVKFAIEGKELFTMWIDQRKYTGVKSFMIRPVQDPVDTDEQFSIRVASFCGCYS
jgi:hypothetical protein